MTAPIGPSEPIAPLSEPKPPCSAAVQRHAVDRSRADDLPRGIGLAAGDRAIDRHIAQRAGAADRAVARAAVRRR